MDSRGHWSLEVRYKDRMPDHLLPENMTCIYHDGTVAADNDSQDVAIRNAKWWPMGIRTMGSEALTLHSAK